MGLFKEFYLNESEVSKAAKTWGLKHIGFNHYKDPRNGTVWTWNEEFKKFIKHKEDGKLSDDEYKNHLKTDSYIPDKSSNSSVISRMGKWTFKNKDESGKEYIHHSSFDTHREAKIELAKWEKSKKK